MVQLLAILVAAGAAGWSVYLLYRLQDRRLLLLFAGFALIVAHYIHLVVKRGGLDYTPDDPVHLALAAFGAWGVYLIGSIVARSQRARQQLAEREERMRALLSQTPALLWTTDKELRYTSSSGSGLRTLGLETGELVGRHIADFFGTEDPDHPAVVAHRRALEGDSVELITELEGSHFQTFVEPLKDHQGRVFGTVGTALNISDRVRNERLLRRLALELQSVREKERTAIAREIHDEFGQALTGLKMELAWLRDHVSDDETRARAASMTELVEQTLDSSRRLASDLRPPVLDDLGLEAAIESHAREFAARSGVECDLDLEAGEIALDPDRDTAVFRILQEALTNVARHADAKHVTVRTARENGTLLLEVTDDGEGIDKESSAAGLGIVGMRERAGALGGTLQVKAADDGGTVVAVRVPIGEKK
jgi:PAS domain S-box-containing protein